MKIANKIVVALLSLAVFPLVATQTLIKLVLSVNEQSLAYTFLKMILGNDNMLTSNRMLIERSAIDLFQMATGQQKSAISVDLKTLLSFLPEDAANIKRLAIAAACLIALGLLIAIVILGCALFTNAYKTIACLGLGGSACFLGSVAVFHQAAKPFLDGTIDVVDLLSRAFAANGTDSGSLATALLSNTVNVDVLTLSGAVFFGVFLLFGVAVWEFAYYVTLPEEEKKKAKEA